MKYKPLRIGDLTASIPLVQGGMGIGISLSKLAGAVANEGGVGIISTAQIGFREEQWSQKPIETNLKALVEELKRAREIAPKGILGFNIMVATKRYEDYVRAAVKAGADIIVSGAGLPVDLPKYVEGFKTKIAPIVSSVKAATLICKLWGRRYNRMPDMVVIEGPKAGGHLGFTPEEATSLTCEKYDLEIGKIIDTVKQYAKENKCEIPVVVAGGIYSTEDVRHVLDDLHADGVQISTRLVTTKECDALQVYKEAYINAGKEDIVITKSPVGMPGRAIANKFLASDNKTKIKKCYQCLEKCEPSKIPYCITQALVNAAKGDLDNALIFCGSQAWRNNKIDTIHDIVVDLFY
jgi:Dioxygenases related to 2-nitropropane dioxygenase